MLKYLLLSFLNFGVIFSALSQKTQVISEVIEWNDVLIENQKKPLLSNAFLAPNVYKTVSGVPRFTKTFPINSNNFTAALTVLSSSPIQGNNTSNYPDKVHLYKEVLQERKVISGLVSFVPIYNKNGVAHRINKFSIVISESNRGKTYRGPTFANSSKLSTGEIYQLGIKESGLYKIDLNFLRNTLEINQNITASNIKILGGRGGIIPESLEEARIDDLEEIPYFLQGGNDNSFDAEDFIVFYAEGSDCYKIKEDTYDYEKNIYDISNYYYIKVDATIRKSIPQSSLQSDNPEIIFDNYDKYQRFEEDKTNLLGQFSSAQGSGQNWYGDIFKITRERNYSNNFNFNNLVLNSNALFNIGFAGRSRTSSSVQLKINGQNNMFSISSVSTGNVEARYASHINKVVKTTLLSPEVSIAVEYPQSNENEGWLDYIESETLHSLKYTNELILFRKKDLINYKSIGLSINNLNNPIIWDVSDPVKPSNIAFSNSNGNINFAIKNEFSLRQFAIFDPLDVSSSPTFIAKIDNQDIHAIAGEKLVILYHRDFQEAATRLSQHKSSLNIPNLIIPIDEIYHEFSSGKKDPTAIRDFAKMIYDRNAEFKYLLLIGDATYDYRNITPNLPDHNFIPTYESEESLHPIEAFPSDDYFGLLSDFEGENLIGQLEIAVGRLPVKTKDEANTVVNKIIRYETDPKTLGDWRLRIGFTADDEDFNIHLNQAEAVARNTENKFPLFNLQKVYFDAFEQESTPGGARYPGAADQISKNIFKGQLVLNYLGHGGPKGWAQERVLKVNDILGWKNFYKLPLLITATCSFTGFDDPSLISAGEYSLLSENGGAIGLLTTVRAVYSNENARLTGAVFDTLFSVENNEDLTIGEIIQRSKNRNWQDTARINARKFALIGDPSLKLSIPKYKIETTAINGIPIDLFSDTLNAQERVKVSGKIVNRNGQFQSTYNGKIFPTIFDKKSKQQTLKNDSRSRSQEFEITKSVIFKGIASVVNGNFEFEFLIPKDIDYSFGKGKMSFYSTSNDLQDAAGYYNNFYIGGSSDNVGSDKEGPEINLYMNDEKFVYGGITSMDPTLLIKLNDASGINTTGTSIGHDLIAELDGDAKNAFILNDFYEAEIDDFTSGNVRFPINDLVPGIHTLKIKAWDVVNNSSEKIIEFRVIDENDAQLKNVYNYPNPFNNKTKFMFEHDLAGSDLDVIIHIYSMSGKVVKSISDQFFAAGYRADEIEWNGKDDYGSKLGKGIYLYKIKISDLDLGISRESDFQKLVILN